MLKNNLLIPFGPNSLCGGLFVDGKHLRDDLLSDLLVDLCFIGGCRILGGKCKDVYIFDV